MFSAWRRCISGISFLANYHLCVKELGSVVDLAITRGEKDCGSWI